MMQNKTLVLIILLFSLSQSLLTAQKSMIVEINWSQNTEFPENATFSQAQFREGSDLPFYASLLPTKSYGKSTSSIVSYDSEPVSFKRDPSEKFPFQPEITSHIIQERNNHRLNYSFFPFIRNRNTGQVERITKLEFTYNVVPVNLATSRGGPEFKTNSVLRDGEIFKVAVSKSGIYKINSAFLAESNIDLSNTNPKNIQIFGNPGGMNPEANADDRYDDLEENAIFIQGEADGSFDSEDYILFYAHGPNTYDDFEYIHNIYDDNNYYFIKIGSTQGKRVSNLPNSAASSYATNFDTYKRYEKDEYNLLADFASAQGSGKVWFSDKYRASETQDFSNIFADPNLDITENVNFEIKAAGRSSSSSSLRLKVGNNEINVPFNKIQTSNIQAIYADLETRSSSFKLTTTDPSVELSYTNASGDANAWLDYLFMEYKSNLKYSDAPVIFKNREELSTSTFGYQIANYNQNLKVWDVTDPGNIKDQEVKNGRFAFESKDRASEFVMFNPASALNQVTFVSTIENQNLHSISKADAIIVFHPDFQDAAERLASHRSDHSNLSIVTIPIGQVNNEFSSGRVDVAGLRNFARMVYLRDPNFKFLTLLGDGSYDYKHRDKEFGDDNFIPVYQTNGSLSPINSFPTDDFYALLDEQEGDNLVGGIDIAVGRIPARSVSDATIAVDKIIKYDTDEDTFDDWRLRIGFAADDEDSNVHFRDSDEIAEMTRLKYKDLNVEKIYFDAFPQVSTPGGERYPQATDALYNNLFKGMLTLCYLGHGGPKGWAQERVLKREDVAGWNNAKKLPLMVTATCSFTGFDNPADISAGETILFEENGGAIALMSTVRAVYVNRNKALTESVFDTIFTKPNNKPMGIGEVLRRAKNSKAQDTVNVNSRKFLLFGDPSLTLGIPQFNIVTSSVNGIPVDGEYKADTIGALQKMSFSGFVADLEGRIMDDFNGVVTASVFDKLIQATTLGNNTGSTAKAFNLQKTVLFKGQSAVENGKFTFEFYLPADINFAFGKGKISLYAKSGNRDASGRFEDFYIGGSSEGVADDTPPTVDIFLNDEDFVFGGISNSEPILIVKLADDFGINVAGVSVGHDLVAELDNKSKERYILNDFYEADLNDFRSGTVKFPLKDIEPGKHTLKIKAWDLSNNPGEGYTEFIVVDDMNSGLEHVFNYPNPFTTRTLFQFEHSLPGTELEIIIHIYNMSGQIVKTIEHLTIDDGFRIDDISWDGMDDYGQKIANGVYLYKINVHAIQLGIRKESNYEKLVILK